MYFRMKNTLKSNLYYTSKHPRSMTILVVEIVYLLKVEIMFGIVIIISFQIVFLFKNTLK
jgi:hypothetical protein